MIFHLNKLMIEMLKYNKQNRVFLTSVIILSSSFLINSCSQLQPETLEKGARFINESSNNFVQKESTNKTKLTTSYIENEKKICIYVSDKSKIITETSKSLNCPSEI